MGVRGLQVGSRHKISEEKRREWVFADCRVGAAIEAATRGAENGRSRIAAGEP